MNGQPPNLTGVTVRIVGIHYSPEPTGNAPYTTLMAESIAAAGATVEVVTGIPHYPAWVADPSYRRALRWHESIHDVKVLRIRHTVPNPPTVLGRAIMEASFFTNALPAVFGRRVDVTIAVTPSLAPLAVALATNHRAPVGVLVQDLTGSAAAQSGSTSQRVGGLLSEIEYRMLARCDRVGVITPDFTDVLVANGVDPSQVVNLPNCTHIVTSSRSRNEARKHLGWDPTHFLAVYTGTLGKKQGLEILIEGARKLSDQPSIQFVLVGSGGERAHLETLAADLCNVRFVDPVASEDYPDVLAAADVLLLAERPGVLEMSLPSKLTSYATAGRPILASVEQSGITGRLLQERRAAILTPAGDAARLAEAIDEVAKNRDIWERLSSASAELLQPNLTREAAARRYQNFAADLIELGGHTRSRFRSGRAGTPT